MATLARLTFTVTVESRRAGLGWPGGLSLPGPGRPPGLGPGSRLAGPAGGLESQMAPIRRAPRRAADGQPKLGLRVGAGFTPVTQSPSQARRQ